MSHPVVGDPEWDQLQCNYDPLGEHTPLTGRFSNTTVSDLQPFSLATPSTTSAPHHTNPPRGHPHPQTTTASNPPLSLLESVHRNRRWRLATRRPHSRLGHATLQLGHATLQHVAPMPKPMWNFSS
ncbi:uncharacterized protein PGTG_02245 [Puccinia graminis f. sp. tritici CRL 75-36-700-3]|uniref:Uncharacterized protein n=1 Tax=Puccinia graminis f. sp. tritici (strain CRL 75-36-700-3 / race SCCL) TaxID=418459 RepID=E3JXK9_PUCGT|nr:uncharacterized protein PGTG_02245 [Puccinia graminis f. sp. tritici CRL 75-36-700-3]EFP76784.2 hypothetical protein PGTG_02245 [Puccinia graminis f. sp. tritici CRL 75-36-700-3]